MTNLQIAKIADLDKIKTWNEITNDEQQFNLVIKLDDLEKQVETVDINDLAKVDKLQKELNNVQKELNKFNAAFVKPIKQALKYAKDDIVGAHEKLTIERAKKLKKTLKDKIEASLNIEEVVVEEITIATKCEHSKSLKMLNELLIINTFTAIKANDADFKKMINSVIDDLKKE